MSESLHLAIRTVHVLGMAVLIGGAAGVWATAWRGSDDLGRLARTYEWAFWAALGAIVVTGIGNLGALGAPGPETRWGQFFLTKLVLVTVVVLASAVRTMAVVRAGDGVQSNVLATWSERAYGLTTAGLFVIVVFAEVLAHG